MSSVAARWLAAACATARERVLAALLDAGCSGGGRRRLPRLDIAIARLVGGEPPTGSRATRRPRSSDRALYIYTSGTTGLPKAANVSHLPPHAVEPLVRRPDGRHSPSDRMYNCLPMYHSVGGVVATGATLVGGGTVVLRERFSASDFWQDVVAERCTLFQYIGELCRYLLGSPPQPDEAQHSAAPVLRQRAARGRLGARSRSASGFRRSSSTTPPPRATSRSTTAKGAPARSGASRPSCRIACRSRWCASMWPRGAAGARCERPLRALRRGRGR